MSIAFIAPYESLHALAQSVIAAGGYPAVSCIGDMLEGVNAARAALENGAKVIISRGGTARAIREELGVEPVEVGISVHSVLAFLHNHTTPKTRVAVAGYRQFLSAADPVCRILQRQYACFEMGGEAPASDVIAGVIAWKPDIVLGDAVSVRLARSEGLPCHLIESEPPTLVDAFERAMQMLTNINRHAGNVEKIAAVLNCAHEGAMLVSDAGLIEEVNRRGCLLLRMPRADLAGMRFDAALPSDDVRDAVNSGKNVSNLIVPQGEGAFVVSVVPAMSEKNVGGTVILFQQVEDIQQAASSIRKAMPATGFRAVYSFRDILYRSPAMQKTTARAKEYSVTACNIMIQGETGTGKELFAQSIHNAGPLAKGPFVAVNCAALPGSLLESELFGYAPGAFTGALRRGKTGLFELAHQGTLFLDEICEMDIVLQARLLRAIQTGEIMRIGDHRITPVNVRIIAATNRNPAEEAAAGRMRADLFFRLNVLDLVIPPLRERQGDAPYLFSHYVAVYEAKTRRQAKRPPAAFLRELATMPWPGNVRELENLAEKHVILSEGLGIEDLRRAAHPLPAAPQAGGNHEAGRESLHEVVAHVIRAALAKEGGNLTRAASRLGVDRNTIRRRLKKGGASSD